MSVIFEGIEMPKACCFVDGEHSSFAHFEYCKFYNICKQRETFETDFRPNDCPVKPINQEMITKNDLGVDSTPNTISFKGMMDNLKITAEDIENAEDLEYSIEPLNHPKNDLEVDCISRADAIQAMQDKAKKLTNEDTINGLCGAVAILFDLPSVTPQEPVLDKIRAEIAEYGSIWVEYAITGHSDRDIQNLIEGVLKQAKEQVLNVIDKYKTESEK